MDQDFHYYGTNCAAEKGGFTSEEAALIAKAANFIDFFNNTTYAAYWKLVSDKNKKANSNYDIVAKMDNPRYTFQGTISSGASPEDGLWCSFHFTPGNYDEPSGTPSRETVHGQDVANFLSPFVKRDTNGGKSILTDWKYYTSSQRERYSNDLKYGRMLNRPQSALSRQMIIDAVLCATNDDRLKSILKYAKGGKYILDKNKNGEDNLRRFKLILLGVRAHVIADTWAHQDCCGLDNVLNTYWDANYNPKSLNPKNWGYGRQSIDYNDGTFSGWKNRVLSSTEILSHPNFAAVPNGTSYLGHGWLGHLPDFSFIKYRYKPCWHNPAQGPIERNNIEEYKKAWVELVSLFTQAKGNGKLKMDAQFKNDLNKAVNAIKAPCNLEGKKTGRKSSAQAWQEFYNTSVPKIDVDAEPDSKAVLDGMIEATKRKDRYGTDYVNINSDLYLFQIAADYHFHFVKNYLERHNIYKFGGSWSKQESALSPNVSNLFA